MQKQDGVVTVRFLATKAGTVHVVDRSPSDKGTSSCPIVGRMLNSGEWKGRRSLSPDAALDLKDCAKCETHKLAKAEIRAAKGKARVQRPLSGPDHPRSVRNNGGGSKRLKVASTPLPPIEDKGQRLADEHAKLAKDHGWAVDVAVDPLTGPGPRTWIVVARKGDERVQAAWTDGKVNYPLVIAFFPTHQFWLKNTTQWRRQVSLPDSERPAKREPKTRPPRVPASEKIAGAIEAPVDAVPETEGIKFNSTQLPFEKDALDAEVIDLLKGRKLYWRNNFASKIENAEVPGNARMVRIAEHPTNGRRIVSFPEVAGYDKDGPVYGCERSVAVDQMIKVK